jgi:2-polyprenyl-6-methoxyphenol hydroxylase-like FAD-dependent oxidoreductase
MVESFVDLNRLNNQPSTIHNQTATIIGAGPAGSLAALLLARGGWTVTLIEQHRFPRDKVCGECLSALGIEVLERSGLIDLLRQHHPVLLHRAVFASADGREMTVALPRPMWGLSRRVLDQTLLDAAIAAGAHVMQPARCERVELDPVRITVRGLEDNALTELQSSVLLLADGKGAFALEKPALTGDLGVKAHYRDVEDAADNISLFGLDGHYIGLAPIEGGLWNLAMSVPAAKVKEFDGDMDRLLEQVMRENDGLRLRFRAAKRVGEVLTSSLPRFGVARSWPRGIIPIGNAAAALEPIGGEGMGLALSSAEIVATELLERGCDYDGGKLRARMRKLWDRRRAACRAGGMLLSRPRIAKLVTRIGRPLGPMALKAVGK